MPEANFLYRLKAARPAMVTEGPTLVEQEVLGRHFAYLQSLIQTKALLLAGRTDVADSMGIAIFYAPDESAAQSIMQADPAVKEGIMTAELFPFRLALLAKD